jgi:hypothetical protein
MAYRQDRDALEERRAEIETRLSDIRSQARAAEEERSTLERDLDDVKARLRRARGLPILDNIRVASPCSANWDEMKGDDRVRFCGHCEKNVYNLSTMTREQAEELIAEKEGNLCARFYRRADGTILTADCPVGVRKKRVRRLALVGVGAGALAAASAFALTRTHGAAIAQGDIAQPPDAIVVAGGITMGDVAEAPTAPSSAQPMGHVRMGVVAPRNTTANPPTNGSHKVAPPAKAQAKESKAR